MKEHLFQPFGGDRLETDTGVCKQVLVPCVILHFTISHLPVQGVTTAGIAAYYRMPELLAEAHPQFPALWGEPDSWHVVCVCGTCDTPLGGDTVSVCDYAY